MSYPLLLAVAISSQPAVQAALGTNPPQGRWDATETVFRVPLMVWMIDKDVLTVTHLGMRGCERYRLSPHPTRTGWFVVVRLTPDSLGWWKYRVSKCRMCLDRATLTVDLTGARDPENLEDWISPSFEIESRPLRFTQVRTPSPTK